MSEDLQYDLDAIERTASTLDGAPWRLEIRFLRNGICTASLVPAVDGPAIDGNGPSLGSALADLAAHSRIVRSATGR